MSNDKAAATYHGHKRAFLTGDWVYVTQLPEYDHRLGQVDDIRDSMFPYLVRFDNGEQYGAFDWLALTPAAHSGQVWHYRIGDGRTACGITGSGEVYASEMDDVTCGACYQAVARETTGEHVFHKFGDDLYQDWADDAEAHIALHMRPKLDWTPTPVELGLALGIMAFIVLLFVFFAFFYRGW